MRLHRSLRSVNPGKIANRAEDYLEGLRLYSRDLEGVRGLVSRDRLKKLIVNIDKLEREIAELEDKIERVSEKRKKEALKLEDYLKENLDVLEGYLERDELEDFR